MTFTKFVEIGRVVFLKGGVCYGKLAVIIDVIDYKRVLIDGPCTGVKRQAYHLRNISITKFKIDIHHSQKSKLVEDAWKKAGIGEHWQKTPWAQSIELKKRKLQLTDFDRFNMAKLKRRRNGIIKRTCKTVLADMAIVERKCKLKYILKKESDPDKLKKLNQQLSRLPFTKRKGEKKVGQKKPPLKK